MNRTDTPKRWVMLNGDGVIRPVDENGKIITRPLHPLGILWAAVTILLTAFALANWHETAMKIPTIGIYAYSFILFMGFFVLLLTSENSPWQTRTALAGMALVIALGFPLGSSAHDYHNPQLSLKGFHTMASRHNGRIAFYTGYVSRGRRSSSVVQGGGINTLDKWNHQKGLTTEGLQGLTTEKLQSRILDKHMPELKTTILQGTEACKEFDGDVLCVTQHAGGQYYTGTYIIKD